MIVATAGHIDHGKTLLIKALTGVHTDRLPEERRRGMTIDLGFAYRHIGPDITIGFIDVPGHERFIRNMLCGVAGIDFVLFVVAVDDGPMPQTREHLAILDLLGIPRGAVVLTKTDRVMPERVKDVAAEVRTLLTGTTLERAAVFPVSTVTADGIKELGSFLEQAACECPVRSSAGNFRMPVDRCFTIAGAGLVATGTAVSGSIAAGNSARALHVGVPVRVRSIHAQHKPCQTGRAGQRCALNLAGAGLKNDLIVRGDWIVTGGVPVTGQKLDARLKILANEKSPFVHWTSSHLHLGAGFANCRVAVLEGGREISPGKSALVQLVLDRPIGALGGDRFIIRDQSAKRTIGGGRIVDVFPPARGRAKPERIAFLEAMENNDDAISLELLIELAAQGLNLSNFAANRNLTLEEAGNLFARSSVRSVTTQGGLLGFSRSRFDDLKSKTIDQLAAWHSRAPDTVGLAENRILQGSDIRVPREVAAAVIAELVVDGIVAKDGTAVRLITHRPKLNPAAAALWKKVLPVLDDGGLRPPSLQQIAVAIGEDFAKYPKTGSSGRTRCASSARSRKRRQMPARADW
jgi:selenocysteine-specific elongation factor